jgi:hypothetical protein
VEMALIRDGFSGDSPRGGPPSTVSAAITGGHFRTEPAASGLNRGHGVHGEDA